MTIRTILVTLVTLFHNKPLLNEPGITEKHHAFNNYNKIIEYRNYDTAIRNIMLKKILPDKFKALWPIIKKHFETNKKNIMDKIDSLIKKNPDPKEFHVGIYSMSCTIDYKYIKKQIENAFKEL